MKRVKFLLAASIFIVGGLLFSLPVHAQCEGFDCVDDTIDRTLKPATSNTNTVESFSATITDIIIYLVGAVSVIMIIYGGIIYAISGGDSTKAKKAKDTILYAVIGLVVAILAYAIVTFVIRGLVR